MVRVCVLASGSGGNMVYIEGRRGALVVDAGLSLRETLRRMAAVRISPDGVCGILVTHEHADHGRGVGALSRHFRVPVAASVGTAQGFQAQGVVPYGLQTFQPGHRFSLGPFLVEPFPVPHDANQPVGYVIWDGPTKVAVVTDLGYLPLNVQNHVEGAELLILESNHDVELLLKGSYPPWLKQRILSRHGHLSNAAVAEFVRARLDKWCRYLLLAHLSQENNRPELALASVMNALYDRRNDETRVVLTAQDVPTPVIEVE